jgi:hypothetical protein
MRTLSSADKKWGVMRFVKICKAGSNVEGNNSRANYKNNAKTKIALKEIIRGRTTKIMQIVHKKQVHLNVFTKNQDRAVTLHFPTESFAPSFQFI